jgi:hypothetical protein
MSNNYLLIKAKEKLHFHNKEIEKWKKIIATFESEQETAEYLKGVKIQESQNKRIESLIDNLNYSAPSFALCTDNVDVLDAFNKLKRKK